MAVYYHGLMSNVKIKDLTPLLLNESGAKGDNAEEDINFHNYKIRIAYS